MEKVAIEIRKTHRYVDSCRHLDEHEYLGVVKVTPARQIEAPKDYDDGGKYVRFARLPVGMDKERAIRALADTFSHWGCAHEHDCCGCQLVSTTVERTASNRTLRLVSTVGYNY